MCGGCLSVAYTLTGVRGNDDDDESTMSNDIFECKSWDPSMPYNENFNFIKS